MNKFFNESLTRYYIKSVLRAHKDQSVIIEGTPYPEEKIIMCNAVPENDTVKNPIIIKRTLNEAIEEAIEYITYLEDRVQKLEEESEASDIDYDLFIQVLRSTLTHDEYNRFMKKIMTINAKCREYLDKGV